MKLKIASLVFLLVLIPVYSLDIDISVGPAYAFYGFHAAEGTTVELESQYHTIGADLGGTCILTPEWEIRSNLFLGFPVSGAVYLDNELYNKPDLSEYDLYSFYFNLTTGPAYRIGKNAFSLSLGPILVLNDFVLAASDDDPEYVISYTLGIGGAGHIEYSLDNWILYADIKGAFNFREMLVKHDDFSYAYGGEVSLGGVWRL